MTTTNLSPQVKEWKGLVLSFPNLKKIFCFHNSIILINIVKVAMSVVMGILNLSSIDFTQQVFLYALLKSLIVFFFSCVSTKAPPAASMPRGYLLVKMIDTNKRNYTIYAKVILKKKHSCTIGTLIGWNVRFC